MPCKHVVGNFSMFVRRCDSSPCLSLNGVPVPFLDDEDTGGILGRSGSSILRPETAPAAMDVSHSQPQFTIPPILPVFPQSGCIHRISFDTAAGILRGQYRHRFDSFSIIDCRYDYEYIGGHIKESVHMADPNDFVELFFDTPRLNWVVIFHCEFSHNRGPKMAMQFRDYDRSVNKVSYPALYYPQTFILDGGYRDFYEHYPELCDGQYVPMLEETHRRNGDLSRCTSDYQEVVSSFDKILHPSANRGLHTHLMSPKQRRLCQSPVTKTMCCLSSPRCLHKRSDEMFQAQMTGFGPEFA